MDKTRLKPLKHIGYFDTNAVPQHYHYLRKTVFVTAGLRGPPRGRATVRSPAAAAREQGVLPRRRRVPALHPDEPPSSKRCVSGPAGFDLETQLISANLGAKEQNSQV